MIDLTCKDWFESNDLPPEFDQHFEAKCVDDGPDYDVEWDQAVTFVSNAEAVEHQKYRIVMFIAGHDVEGPWLEYKPEVFKIEALRLARAGVGFSVEFTQ